MATDPEELEAKAHAALAVIFGAERAAEILAASPVPIAEAFAELRELAMAEWLAAANRIARAAARARKARARVVDGRAPWRPAAAR